MEGVAATDGLGLLSVGLLVGHAAPDAATGSVIVRFATCARVMASISMRLSTSEPLFVHEKNDQYEESYPCACGIYTWCTGIKIIICVNTECMLNVLSPSHAGTNT